MPVGSGDRSTGTVERLSAARLVAKERYRVVAEALKREAGVTKHYKFKTLGGLAFTAQNKILAPEGVTRRQLYVLAHECGHIVLHGSASAQAKPGHVKEHEAEVYAHRAFKRYGLDVPDQSAQWARAYVGQWITKDRNNGIAICPMAVAFADWRRGPDEPLPGVDGMPKDDFSKSIDRFVEKGLSVVAKEDRARNIAVSSPPIAHTGQIVNVAQAAFMKGPPNACGTCLYFENGGYDTFRTEMHDCSAYAMRAQTARKSAHYCGDGQGRRPHPDELRKLQQLVTGPRPGFWSRLIGAIINRKHDY